jgi:ABC-type uncharacterized transport system substrate-binding protein
MLAAPLGAEAQQAGKIPKIGLLSLFSSTASQPALDAFRQGLREHGYVEGRNIAIEWRYAEGRWERVPRLVGELVDLNVDVFFVGLERLAVAARQATANIPIVMALAEDPVGAGLVKSLAHPGGNVTGLTVTVGPELVGKSLELLTESLPKGMPIAVLFDPASRGNAIALKGTQEAGRTLSVKTVPAAARNVEDIDKAFALMKREHAVGFLVLGEALFYANRARITDLGMRNGLASMWLFREGADAGGMMSYGANVPDLFRRAVGYIDKILKGVKPGDLPIEQPTKFEFVINLKTAKALGLTIPPSLLLRADQVLE